jgi:hypothetical protein
MFSTEPSLESMESFLKSAPDATSHVSEVMGNGIVRIDPVDGVGIGSWVKVGENRGIVIQFNKNFMTVGVIGQSVIHSGVPVEPLVGSLPFRFYVPCGWKDQMGGFIARPKQPKISTTGSVIVDFLLGEKVPRGITTALYGKSEEVISTDDDSVVIRFPRTEPGFAQYIDLFECAKEAVESSKTRATKLIVDLRQFENACKSIQWNAKFSPLPVSPASLVASVLQLSNGSTLSVIALANTPSDFDNELERSVDIGIELDGVSNLFSILKRFNRPTVEGPSIDARSALIKILIQEHDNWTVMSDRTNITGLHTDYWEREQLDSFETLKKVIPPAAAFAKTHTEQVVLMRALTILHFNKTSKLHRNELDAFPREMFSLVAKANPEILRAIGGATTTGTTVVPRELCNRLDETIMNCRTHLEITSPI